MVASTICNLVWYGMHRCAFLAYKLETRNRQQGGEVGLITYKDFLHRLAYQLIHNGGVQRRLRRRNIAEEDNDDEPEQVSGVLLLLLLSL
jgi:hypothetical protein